MDLVIKLYKNYIIFDEYTFWHSLRVCVSERERERVYNQLIMELCIIES